MTRTRRRGLESPLEDRDDIAWLYEGLSVCLALHRRPVNGANDRSISLHGAIGEAARDRDCGHNRHPRLVRILPRLIDFAQHVDRPIGNYLYRDGWIADQLAPTQRGRNGSLQPTRRQTLGVHRSQQWQCDIATVIDAELASQVVLPHHDDPHLVTR